MPMPSYEPARQVIGRSSTDMQGMAFDLAPPNSSEVEILAAMPSPAKSSGEVVMSGGYVRACDHRLYAAMVLSRSALVAISSGTR